MKHIIFFLFISTTVFAQTPRLKFRQIQKDTTQGSIAISNPADSQLVFSRDFYISYGVDTVLILYGDTIGVGGTLDAEQVQDIVGAMVKAGLGLDVTYNDVDGELLLESLSIEDSVKNETLTTITKGTPLYAVTTVGNYWSVEPADATDPAKMPVIAIAGEDLIAGATGVGLILGHIKGVNVPTTWSAGDEVWVGANGTFINHEPATEDTLIQRLGSIIKTGTNGSGIISIGDVNKNLNNGNIFIGDATGKVTTAQYIVDSTRLNVTGDTAFYYQNGVSIGFQEIAGGGGGGLWSSGATAGEIYYNGGNVGIGVADPSNTLDVVGTTELNGAVTQSGGNVTINEGNGNYDFRVEGDNANSTHMLFADASENEVRLNSTNTYAGTNYNHDNGNYLLQVNGGDNSFYTQSGTVGVDFNVGRKFSTGTGYAYGKFTADAINEKFIFSNATDTTLYVDATNNRVGIGTSTPTLATLQIISLDGSNINGLRIDKGTADDTTSGFKNLFIGTGYASDPTNIDNNITMGLFQKKNRNNNYANFNFFNANGSNVGGFGMQYINHTGKISDFYIATANGGSPTTKMTIKGNGNVGIGTSTPLAKLSIKGGISLTDPTVGVGSNTNDNPLIYIYDDSQTTSGPTDAEFSFSVAGQGSTAASQGPVFGMRGKNFSRFSGARGRVFFLAAQDILNPTGDDGTMEFITNGGSLKIEYDGDISIGGATVGSDDILMLPNSSTARATAYAWDTYSDERIKSNFESIENAISMIKLMNPQYYIQYQSDYDSLGNLTLLNGFEKTLGFVAQELISVLPEAVNQGIGNELWSVNYTKLIPITVKAIQEQQAIIETQATEIDQLKTLITDLTNRLTILENK